MAPATATAAGGQVRSAAVRRTCWRLALLLGLAWAALLLLGGTAHATCDGPTCEQAAATDRADTRPGVPLVGQLLASTDEPTPAQPLRQVADLTVAALDALGRTTPAVPDPDAEALPALPAAAEQDLAGPAATDTAPVGVITNTVRDTLEDTGERLTLRNVPSVRSTVTPLLDGLTRQVVETADDAVDAVEVLAAPLPIAGALLPSLRTTVDALSRTARLAVGATDTLTQSVDEVVGVTAAALSPVAEVVERIAGTVGDGDTAGPVTGAGPSAAAGTTGSGPAFGVVMVRIDGPQAGHQPGSRALPGPAVPPPSTTDLVPAVQPAADTVSVLPVPVSGAGSISGNGGGTSAPRPDQPLVRVVPEDAGSHEVIEPVTRPTGAMPGTPAADPAFSPD